jgi:chemotaxis protein MotB
MDNKHPEIIVIKRHSGHDEEHHGGAWKIAFADFMTAMMAFFLVLWIINATDKNTKTIIARYFNPLKLEDMAKAKKGIRLANGDDSKEQPTQTADKSPPAPSPPAPAKTADDNAGKAPAKAAGEGGGKESAGKNTGETGMAPADPAHPEPHFSESALFADPYARLDQIAGRPPAPQPPARTDAPTMPDAVSGGEPAVKANAAAGGDAAAAAEAPDLRGFVDPFKPSAGSAIAGAPPREPTPPAASVAASPPAATSAEPPALANAAEPPPGPAAVETAAASSPPASAAGGAPPLASLSGVASTEAAKLQNELARAVRVETHGQPAPGVEVRKTAEGTLISLTDQYDFGMFATGSAEPQPAVVRIMQKIAESLKSRPGSIVVRGFTDNRPYRSKTYDNWRLSEARAQMAYYMLVRGGLDEKRVERIEGYADRRPKLPARPDAAENRRIEILVEEAKP